MDQGSRASPTRPDKVQRRRKATTSKLVTYAGIVASVILIAFGIGSIVVGFNGRDRVQSDLAREQIVGTDDSTIPGQKVDTGSEAQAFADVTRKHTLESTGGQTYFQMGRFLDENGKPTSDHHHQSRRAARRAARRRSP